MIGLAAAALAAAAGFAPFLRTLELKTYDWRVRLSARPTEARRDIVLVAIDEASVRKLEPQVGRWPWPRLVHAQLVNYLARGPARVVVYDVLFTERDRRTFTAGDETWTGEDSDRALVEATLQAGNVIYAADAVPEALEKADKASRLAEAPVPGPCYVLDDTMEERPVVTPPFPDLARAGRALGHNVVVYDPDGPLRRLVAFVRIGRQFVPSLPIAASMVARGISPDQVRIDDQYLWLGSRAMPLIDVQIPSFYGKPRHARRALINYRGPVIAAGRPTYRDYSFYDLFYSEQQLLAGQKPYIDPAAFRDKIVVVGTTAPGLSDLFTVPFGEGKMPGMEVHANIIDSILSGRFMRPAPGWTSWVALVVLGCGVALASAWLGLWVTVGVAAASVALFGWLAVGLFRNGVWLQMTSPLLAVALATFGGVAYQYLVEGREKRKVKQLFSRFVSRDVYDHLLANPAAAKLGGQRRRMSVLFSDIRGFTTVSERGQPEEIVRQLNEHFSRMVHVIFEHRGTIDKFVGDMIMALFGAPLDDADHADHAVGAALGMLRELEALNRRWAGEGRPTLDIGVGINTGDMVAGNIGSDTIMSYTVIGDAVNLGSRLESLNKQYGTHIIISEETRAGLKGRYDIRPLGDVVVKGKTKPVAVYEVRAAGAAAADVEHV